MSEGAQTPASEEAETSVVDGPDTHAPVASPGGTLGRYVIFDEVGRGAVGMVLRAYDPKLQREVALKVLRTRALDETSHARLVREARAMARLSHPNVVAVYDVEKAATGVVLVMEYVSGQTLRQWLGEAERPWAEIVGRFLHAGRGLAAAHGEGLLHRDFKPANVLVAASGVVKVTDFGLAKGVDGLPSSVSGGSADPEDALPHTVTLAGSVLGTPRYMPPEQHDGAVLGPAADQYAFCVALWEALTGVPPFSGDELAAQKTEGPPVWPPGTSVPKPVAEAIRRGLASEPADRWPNIDGLLAALAYDPSGRRRNWRLGFGVLAVLAVGGTLTYLRTQAQAQRCTGAYEQLDGVWDDERRAGVEAVILDTGVVYAQGVHSRIESQLDAYADAWAAMHTETCEMTTVRGEQSTAVMDLRMQCLRRANSELAAVTDVLLTADAELVQWAHKLVDGLPAIARCANVEALQAEMPPPSPQDADDVEQIRVHLRECRVRQRAGLLAEAMTALQRAETRLEFVDYRPVVTEAALQRGHLMEARGVYDGAAQAFREALRLGIEHRQWEDVREAAMELLFIVGAREGRPDEGLQYVDVAKGLAVGDSNAQASLHTTVGSVLYVDGKYAEAETEHRRALAIWEQSLGPEHYRAAMSRNNLGNALHAQGRYAEAEIELRAALSLWEKILGAKHPNVAMSRANIANVLQAQAKHAEAEVEYRRVLSQLEEALGPDHPNIAMLRNNLCSALFAREEYVEAENECRSALALYERTLGPEHPKVAMARNNLGSILNAGGKHAEAEVEQRRGLEARMKTFGPEHPLVASSRSELAETLLELDRGDEAASLAELAWSRRRRDDIPAQNRSKTAFILARALWTIGNRERAGELARRALADITTAGDAFAEQRDEILGWQQAHP